MASRRSGARVTIDQPFDIEDMLATTGRNRGSDPKFRPGTSLFSRLPPFVVAAYVASLHILIGVNSDARSFRWRKWQIQEQKRKAIGLAV
ncbi:BHLH domain-containing protein [Psidium guajava]|nr:BHLH domain-containing protein [Psidium guajava]